MEEKKENQEQQQNQPIQKTVEITDKAKDQKKKPSKEEIDIQMELDSMTKEKLKDLCGQQYYHIEKLKERIRSMDMTNIFKRLDYLFKVVEHPEVFPEGFVKQVVDEICEGMYPHSESQG